MDMWCAPKWVLDAHADMMTMVGVEEVEPAAFPIAGIIGCQHDPRSER
jgi:hypothetical protein